jgi:hypothetical protein
MSQPRRKLNMYEPAVFRICIQGELGDSWSDYFGAQSVTVELDQNGNAVTTLISEAMDQGALVGVVNRLNALGMPLISVACNQTD